MTRRTIVFIMLMLGAAGTSVAQPAPALEGAYGGAWFVDEQAVGHHVWAARFGWPLTPRISIGPETAWMIGPGSDRDFTLTGNVVYTFRDRGPAPYVVGGVGLFTHRERFKRVTLTATEGAFTVGGGVRIPIGRRWYVAPDARIGWELHTRIQLGAGILL
jgi:hypothetical protein